MAFTDLKKWIRLICFSCGNPVIPAKLFLNFSKNKRLDEASKIARSANKKCVHCGTVHYIIKKDDKKPLKFRGRIMNEEKKEIASKTFLPHDIEKVLQKITDETVVLMGKNVASHPNKFVLRTIKVPATTIRPDVKRIGGGRSMNDDLTQMLHALIKKNMGLPEMVPDEINEALEDSFLELSEIFFNFVRGGHGAGAISAGSNPAVSLAVRWRGKMGRFRKTQLGKRVMKCARSTIVGDPTKAPDEVGIPLAFARTVQLEETVQDYNKAILMTYFSNGRKKYPGCTTIIRNGEINSIEKTKIKELEVGDIIHRDLIDNDWVMFNRQPSLRPSNISALKCKIYQDETNLTIGFNPTIVALFNADFDGDLTLAS